MTSDPTSSPENVPSAQTCSGCGAAMVANARFCAHCGLPPDSVGRDATTGSTATTGGRVSRDGMPEWLAVVLGVAVVLGLWFVISRPSGETSAADQEAAESEPVIGDSSVADETQLDEATTEETATTTTTTSSAPDPPVEGAVPAAVADQPAVPLSDLDADGWRLLVSDGLTIVDVDLTTGEQTRSEGVGAPIALVDGRLLLYRNSRLGWVSPDDLGGEVSEIVEVPALQRMFTRGREADRPVVVDEDSTDVAVWWPNNNANPQTWVKIRLADGTVVDSISLTETVFGGPEVVATVGSGTFERVDGRWVPVGDLFASAASPQAIVGQQCAQPDSCNWVLLRRGGGAAGPENLAVRVGGPFDLRLVADADRILLLASDGVTEHDSGRFVPMVAANATTLTATNREHVLAMADGAGIGPRSSLVTIVDLDGRPERSVTSIAVSELIPRWLVLVPPS